MREDSVSTAYFAISSMCGKKIANGFERSLFFVVKIFLTALWFVALEKIPRIVSVGRMHKLPFCNDSLISFKLVVCST